MKKIILFIIGILVISGCSKEEKQIETKNKDNEIDIKEPVIKYRDNNKVKVGIYNKNRVVKDFETDFIDGTDLLLYDIFLTNIENVDNNSTYINYKKYYDEYENIENVKTGFYITFEANGKTYEELILDSTKTFSLGPYIYVYLYDDIANAGKSFYSHIEPDQENENTIFSSIKLYLAERSEEITSPITLTVFTYDGLDDFDENNHYRGNSSYTIKISKRN